MPVGTLNPSTLLAQLNPTEKGIVGWLLQMVPGWAMVLAARLTTDYPVCGQLCCCYSSRDAGNAKHLSLTSLERTTSSYLTPQDHRRGKRTRIFCDPQRCLQ